MTLKERLAKNFITQEEYDILSANDKQIQEEIELEEYLSPDIDIAEAKFLKSIEGMPVAVKRKKGIEFAFKCRLLANSAQRKSDRQTAKEWRSLAWSATQRY